MNKECFATQCVAQSTEAICIMAERANEMSSIAQKVVQSFNNLKNIQSKQHEEIRQKQNLALKHFNRKHQLNFK